MTPESVLWPLVAVVALLCGLKGWMVAHVCRHDMKVQSAAISERIVRLPGGRNSTGWAVCRS